VKEITRDALLEKVMHEREIRNHAKKATAAALFIQRVWRGRRATGNIAEQFRDEWDAHLAQSEDISLNAKRISKDIVRPFLFFICRPPKRHQKVDKRDDDQRMVMCFRILLQSINCPDPKKNFCSLAFGSAEEHARWVYQAHKLFSICSSTLTKDRPVSSNVGGAAALVIALAMRLMVSLTDINTWKNFLKECMGDGRLVVWNLINWIANRNAGLYSSVRQYIMKCNSAMNRKSKAAIQTDESFIVTASAITMVLRLSVLCNWIYVKVSFLYQIKQIVSKVMMLELKVQQSSFVYIYLRFLISHRGFLLHYYLLFNIHRLSLHV